MLSVTWTMLKTSQKKKQHTSVGAQYPALVSQLQIFDNLPAGITARIGGNNDTLRGNSVKLSEYALLER